MSKISNIAHNIKNKMSPNDVFITPLPLAKSQIDMINVLEGELWFDPFKNTGNFYNQYPSNVNRDYTEILEDKDFFEYNKKVDVICSNPPYSMIDKVLEKSVELQPRVISYLIGMGNLTARRIEYMNDNGYGLTKIHMCKVFKWFGMSFIVQFEYGEDNIITYDRVVWR